jgi:hypothetical protein
MRLCIRLKSPTTNRNYGEPKVDRPKAKHWRTCLPWQLPQSHEAMNRCECAQLIPFSTQNSRSPIAEGFAAVDGFILGLKCEHFLVAFLRIQ